MAILIPKHGMLRPHGTIHVAGGDGPDLVRDTVMCGHCNRHGLYAPGCGRSLAKCPQCRGVICPDCQAEAAARAGPCLTWERRLDLYEAGAIGSL
jgi:hypothetical protein